MRTIQISTDVFQAIWAARQPGEEDEDSILSRVLDVTGRPNSQSIEVKPSTTGASWIDSRSGVEFPEGFEVFRNYKGRDYRAKVVGRRWHINGTPVAATTINQLSNAIGIGTENGWMGWNYLANGQIKKIAALRPTSRVHRRTVRSYPTH